VVVMDRIASSIVVLLFVVALSAPAADLSAQQVQVDPADVETIDGIIAALYAAISGPVGQPRNHDQFLSVFAPDARLQPTSQQAPNGYLSWTPADYWDRNAEALVQIGFTEAEIGRTTEVFGNVTHVFSTYESYRYDNGEPTGPFSRGINSIQIIHYQDRYWILSLTWDSERADNPIPSKYVGG
jgi:hypothetical protein